MLDLTFTVEETNLISIYKADTIMETIGNISLAIIFMEDKEMREIAKNSAIKLYLLTDGEFTALPFAAADETETDR